MEIPPIKPPAIPADPGSRDIAPPELPFALGQHLFARVVQVLSQSEAVLDLAGLQLKTVPPIPLAPGQVLHVAVRNVTPTIDLELLEAPVQFSERAYALASVLHARQQSPTAVRLSASETHALLVTLTAPDVRGAPPPADSARAELARAWRPVPVNDDAGGLAERLRHAVGASGAFLESKLAATLTAGREPRDLTHLRDDLRVLLARVAPETATSPELERIRTALAGDVMGRQLDLAVHKVRDGEVRLDIPVSIDRALTDVRMRVRDDPPRGEAVARSEGRVIDLTLELPELGRVRASVRWTPGHVAARFAVEGPAAEAALREGVTLLVSRLTTAGFRYATAEVAVDPAAVSELDDDSDPPLPGGSILRVRA